MKKIRIPKTCPSPDCAAENAHIARFCARCGERLQRGRDFTRVKRFFSGVGKCILGVMVLGVLLGLFLLGLFLFAPHAFGDLGMRLGYADMAIAGYRADVRMGPSIVEAHLALARAYQESGWNEEEACDEYQAALNIDSGCIEALLFLADDHLSKGRLDEAAEHYRRILHLQPEHLHARKCVDWIERVRQACKKPITFLRVEFSKGEYNEPFDGILPPEIYYHFRVVCKNNWYGLSTEYPLQRSQSTYWQRSDDFDAWYRALKEKYLLVERNFNYRDQWPSNWTNGYHSETCTVYSADDAMIESNWVTVTCIGSSTTTNYRIAVRYSISSEGKVLTKGILNIRRR